MHARAFPLPRVTWAALGLELRSGRLWEVLTTFREGTGATIGPLEAVMGLSIMTGAQ